jgi:hypothetical protein
MANAGAWGCPSGRLPEMASYGLRSPQAVPIGTSGAQRWSQGLRITDWRSTAQSHPGPEIWTFTNVAIDQRWMQL